MADLGFLFLRGFAGGWLEFVTQAFGGSLKLSSSGLAIPMTNPVVQSCRLMFLYVHKFIKVNIFSVQIKKTLQPTLSCWGVVKLARSGLSASISDHGQAKISVCTLQILQISVANPKSCACWTLDKHSWGSFIGMFLYLVDICTACLLHVLKKWHHHWRMKLWLTFFCTQSLWPVLTKKFP